MARAKQLNSPDLPSTFNAFRGTYPQLVALHEETARVVDRLGPLDRRTCELIKIGICLGGGLESALRSHVRRALEHDATWPEIEQVLLLGMNTCGFPRTVAAWQWATDQVQQGGSAKKSTRPVRRRT
jgi:alkylhydroperoxidase/carboxymuconolactone decarboxylase family protein YurZ